MRMEQMRIGARAEHSRAAESADDLPARTRFYDALLDTARSPRPSSKATASWPNEAREHIALKRRRTVRLMR